MAQAYQNIDRQTLDVIKYPPKFSPLVAYGRNTDIAYNNLRGNQWQFAYRYVYDDFERSVLSPYSKIAIPQGEELADGSYVDDIAINNELIVTLDRGHETVTRIDCYVRKGNTRDWMLYERKKVENLADGVMEINVSLDSKIITIASGTNIDGSTITADDFVAGMLLTGGDIATIFGENPYVLKVEGSNIYVSANADRDAVLSQIQVDPSIIYSVFRNDVLLEGADQSDLARPFDYVPQYADQQEALGGNRIVYAGNIERDDAVKVSGTVEEAIVPIPTYFDSYKIYVKQAYADETFSGWTVEFDIVEGVVTEYMLALVVGGNHYAVSVISTLDNPLTKHTIATALVEKAKVYVPNMTHDTIYVVSAGAYIDVIFMDGAWISDAALHRKESVTKYNSLLASSGRQFGVVYYDVQGRHGAVNVDDSLYLKTTNYTDFSDSDPSVFISAYIHFNHTPPSWADRYQIVATKPDKLLKVRTVINGLHHTTPQIESTATGMLIDINTSLNTYNTNNPKSIVPLYAFEKGDRIRFVAFGSAVLEYDWKSFSKV